jgi:hypothetical protein
MFLQSRAAASCSLAVPVARSHTGNPVTADKPIAAAAAVLHMCKYLLALHFSLLAMAVFMAAEES